MSLRLPDGVKITGQIKPGFEEILTHEALSFLAKLHRKFQPGRKQILNARARRQTEIDAGQKPRFLSETANIRSGEWKVASTPADLQDRRVEITGPAEAKMAINALNSGAKVFMADLEDALSPTWTNSVEGQICLKAAVRKTLAFASPEGKKYQLKDQIATLLVRPRGWHLPERHVLIDGEPMSGSLFDFGLYFFHNAQERLNRGTGPYFYLPKLEGHLEARLWNDVFVFSQKELGIPQGSVRVTVLIETIFAAFEMEEILYELRDHMAGLNAGRWDYIFSCIKKFRNDVECIFPDRSQITMAVPFMRAYSRLLVKSCHKRGAHAIGGMAAFIPSRRDENVNRTAFAKVTEDKKREAGDGFDGTWVAHPDLVPVARAEFDQVLGSKPNQKEKLLEQVNIREEELIDFRVPDGKVTLEGARHNISVALQYIDRWLNGVGAAAIYNLMEDAATAEISRAQLWQWRKQKTPLSEGGVFTSDIYKKLCEEEVQKLGGIQTNRYKESLEILDRLVLQDEFEEFLTSIAYEYLE